MTVREWLLENWQSFDNRPECIAAGSEETDKSKRTVRKVMKSLEDARLVDWEPKHREGAKAEIEGNVAKLSFLSRVPTSVEDLVAIAKLDPEVWEVSKGRVGFWGNEDWGNFQHRCEYRRKYPIELETAVKFISENFKFRYSEHTTSKIAEQSGRMAEFQLPDLHLGRVNTDGTATLQTVKENFENAITYFIENVLKFYPVERVTIALGNDWFNSSNCNGETHKGTKQTEHPIWEETFNLGTQLAIETIARIQQATQAHVEVVMVVANHDYESSFYLGKILEVCFQNNPMVSVQSDKKMYKFVRFGTNLIGYCHKYPAITVSLPLLMANKMPVDWAETSHREWHLAHFHQKSSKIEHADVNGVRIRVFPSPTANSDWEDDQGYLDVREGTMILWDKVRGPIAEFYYKSN